MAGRVDEDEPSEPSHIVREEVLLQLTQLGFASGLLAAALQGLAVQAPASGVASATRELVRAHPKGELADLWSTGEVIQQAHDADATPALSEPALLEEPSAPPRLPGLERGRSAPAPPKLSRLSSAPLSGPARPALRRVRSDTQARASGPVRWRSQYSGTSLAAVVRLLLRAASAESWGLLSDEDAEELQANLRLGALDAVHNQLRSLARAPSGGAADLAQDVSPSAKPQEMDIECPICFDTIQDEDVFIVPCEDEHRLCRSCMRQHVEAVAFPRCPHAKCGYELLEDDVRRACGEGPRLREFQDFLLRRALAQVHGQVACPNPACKNVVICDPERRSRVACDCGHPPFCSKCRQPFHQHVDCGAVGPLRDRWLNWISKGRPEYHGNFEGYTEASQQHQDAVRMAIARHKELEADEEWKSQNCRLCPKCCKPIERTEGCSSMKCGDNYHGGNKQPGCGQAFDWSTALVYKPRVDRNKELPELNCAKLRGAGVKHFFSKCDLCQDMITGPRFRCVHCENFDCCIKCERRLSDEHKAEHVFELIFEPLDPINEDLPVGTEVEVFGLDGAASSLNGVVAKILRYLPDVQMYDLDLPFGGGKPIVPSANVQPAEATNAWEAQEILEKTLAQQEARQFCLNLPVGQRVQVGALDSNPEITNALATIVEYRPGRDYEVSLDSPPEWSCRSCTLLNSAQLTACGACRTSRGSDQGGNVWLEPQHLSPLITEARQVKSLAQKHWVEQEKLVAATLANSSCTTFCLNLPVDQLVQTQVNGQEVFAKVFVFDRWSRCYSLRIENPATTLSQVDPSSVRPLLWAAESPAEQAEELGRRHNEMDKVWEAAKQLHPRLTGIHLGLQVGQWVLFRPLEAQKKSAQIWESTLGRDYTEAEAAEFQRQHGVRPPMKRATDTPRADEEPEVDEIRGVIAKVNVVDGMYSVWNYSVLSLKVAGREGSEIAMKDVRPVLWAESNPEVKAQELIEQHEAELRRLEEATRLEAEVVDCTLDLEVDTVVQVFKPVEMRCKIKAFDRWSGTYTFKSEPRRSTADCMHEHVRPLLVVAASPVEKMQEIRARHEAERSRRERVGKANALAAGAILDLLEGSALELLRGAGTVHEKTEQYIVKSYDRVMGTYSTEAYAWKDIGSSGSTRESKSFVWKVEDPEYVLAPVFWLADDPMVAASEAVSRHAADTKRSQCIAEAEKTAKEWVMGLKQGALVWFGEQRPEIKSVHSYSPEDGTYSLKKTGASASSSAQTVACDRVRPCLREAEDLAQALREREEAHEAELRRLDAARIANGATETAFRSHGGFLGLHPGQIVQLTGEGIWRRPSGDHNGHGKVMAYHPLQRTYDIMLEAMPTLQSISSHNSAHLLPHVRLRDLKPLFFESEDPDAALKAMLEQSEDERERLKVAQEWSEKVKGATLNLPANTLVTLSTDAEDAVYTVFSYIPIFQTYQLDRRVTVYNKDVRAFGNSLSPLSPAIPAASVVPFIWESKDPAAEAQRALDGHAQETQRLAAVEFCRGRVPKEPLALPKGLPVTLLQTVTPVATTWQPPPTGLWGRLQSIGSSLNPFKVAKGCAAGDRAFIKSYGGDGTYTLGILQTESDRRVWLDLVGETGCMKDSATQGLRSAPGVPASALLPMLGAAAKPEDLLKNIIRDHEAEVAILAEVDRLNDQAGGDFLDLPVNTRVSLGKGKGEGIVTRYLPNAGAYIVRVGHEGALQTVLASQVRVQFHGAMDPEQVFASLQPRHDAEVARLARVATVNAMAAGWHRRLPPGTLVELDEAAVPAAQWAQLGHAARLTRLSTVMRATADGAAYDVQIGCWDLSGISSASRVNFAAESVRPVFWNSPDPEHDAGELRRAAGIDDAP